MLVTIKATQSNEELVKAAGDLLTLAPDAPEGSIKCVFSTFNVKDSDSDVLLPGSIPEVPVKLCSWGHQWKNLVIGKGVIRTNDRVAVFDGQFFLNTTAGREAYETIKSMGDLQEWSWGFKIKPGASRKGVFNGENVRFIEKTVPIEVSPVLIGANPETGTIDIKSADAELEVLDVEEKALPDQVVGAVETAMTSMRDLLAVVAADAPIWVLGELLNAMQSFNYFASDYSHSQEALEAEGKTGLKSEIVDLIFAMARRFEDEFAGKGMLLFDPANTDEAHKTYAAQGEQVLKTLSTFVARSKSLADYRAKDGRVLSENNRSRLKSVHDLLSSVNVELETLLGDTETSKGQEPPAPSTTRLDDERERKLRLAESRAKL